MILEENVQDEELKNPSGEENAGSEVEVEAAETDTAEAETEAASDTAEEADGADSTDADKPKEKKGLFSKKKNPLQDKLDELTDKYVRQLAEFDNFRKRTEKEKAQMFDSGAGNVITKILPVVDNFERGLASVPEEERETPLVQGFDMIYKQLMKTLEDMDVKPIEALGKEFDPNFHNAVMQVESEEYEEGIVAQEMQKGYTYHDSVIRHSMVAVAK
ncbi:nucleotide exchange factor GrpE [Butyrivibrio sp. MC2013]|uniref:nucleotide exchange factor GrpE n=1 Tax=Butyrivibrio sp. MC2013 TaxID=1280686 RepID=UPI000423E984|nr:nucleotide exchange factor GrpE [Butyrivibrio sp. MC2013]